LYSLFNIITPFRDISNLLLAIWLLLLLFSFFIFIAEQLDIVFEPGSPILKETESLKERVNQFSEHLDELQKLVVAKDTQGFVLTPELERLSTAFFRSESFKEIEHEIEDKYGTVVNVGVKVRDLKESFLRAVNSLSDQLKKQRINANINLFFVLIFATIGIAVLGYLFVYQVKSSDALHIELSPFLLNFIPKFTFVILIETVAFFFLSLYREDRNMIRFFQNEVTNF
jgi:hypothetical protein